MAINLSLVAAIVDPSVRLLSVRFLETHESVTSVRYATIRRPKHQAAESEDDQTYDPNVDVIEYDLKKLYTYKCQLPDVKVGDFVVVDAANKYCIAQVVNEDPEGVAWEGTRVYKWIVARVDPDYIERLVAWERSIRELAKAGETKTRRATLRTVLEAEIGDAIKSMPFASITEKKGE